MATYRPIKKVIIPIVAALIGLSLSLVFMPTKIDHLYKRWQRELDRLSEHAYRIESTYYLDDELASKEEGIWAQGDSHFAIEVNVSDQSVFAFSFTVEGERLFIHSGNEWRQSTTDERFIEEFAPLDHPFQWMKEMLVFADDIDLQKRDGRLEYIASFSSFDKVDFRGYFLEEQKEATLVWTVQDDELHVRFNARPIRPDYLGLFDIYPEKVVYDMCLTPTSETIPALPPEAYTSKGIDD